MCFLKKIHKTGEIQVYSRNRGPLDYKSTFFLSHLSLTITCKVKIPYPHHSKKGEMKLDTGVFVFSYQYCQLSGWDIERGVGNGWNVEESNEHEQESHMLECNTGEDWA